MKVILPAVGKDLGGLVTLGRGEGGSKAWEKGRSVPPCAVNPSSLNSRPGGHGHNGQGWTWFMNGFDEGASLRVLLDPRVGSVRTRLTASTLGHVGNDRNRPDDWSEQKRDPESQPEIDTPFVSKNPDVRS